MATYKRYRPSTGGIGRALADDERKLPKLTAGGKWVPDGTQELIPGKKATIDHDTAIAEIAKNGYFKY